MSDNKENNNNPPPPTQQKRTGPITDVTELQEKLRFIYGIPEGSAPSKRFVEYYTNALQAKLAAEKAKEAVDTADEDQQDEQYMDAIEGPIEKPNLDEAAGPKEEENLDKAKPGSRGDEK